MRPPVMLAALLLLVLGTAAASPAESDTRPSVPSPTTTPRTVRSRAPVRTTTKDPGPDPRNPYKYYARKQEKLVKTLMKTITEHVTPQFLGDISQLNLTGDCTYGLFKMIFGVKQLKPWAIKIYEPCREIYAGAEAIPICAGISCWVTKKQRESSTDFALVYLIPNDRYQVYQKPCPELCPRVTGLTAPISEGLSEGLNKRVAPE
ncbi:hypothetical protein V5799_020770 [Amblyomma americanum]|uniref:Secreted protein n=1 Tax=Amblyomma americanum TaxID=6943 RepID=A0AAQ4ETF7_AMBAM